MLVGIGKKIFAGDSQGLRSLEVSRAALTLQTGFRVSNSAGIRHSTFEQKKKHEPKPVVVSECMRLFIARNFPMKSAIPALAVQIGRISGRQCGNSTLRPMTVQETALLLATFAGRL
jgi:hypothetical protein